ncbi:MAG TPA: RluA family pseudouridine synthase [Peptococcaceae bacterium]|nr:RluA family pseudouridine synthase [Peptococcaceae bacterium]
MKKYQTYQVEQEHQSLTVEQYLKTVLHYSGRKIQKLTRLKGIFLNQRPVFLQKKLKAGDILNVLVLEDRTYGVTPQEGTVDILWEDSKVIVLNKPSGILVHPAGQTPRGTLANYLAYYFQEKGELLTIRPLHRLDRDTSGCVVFAKDAQTQTLLEQQMHDGRFKRTYLGVVQGKLDPPEGIIDLPIGKHKTKPNRRAVQEEGVKAVTYYRTLKVFEQGLAGQGEALELSLLELKLESGRTHQIRVHLAHLGHPLLGDRMYGQRSSLIARQALHAGAVTFEHPQKGIEINVQAPLPNDMKKLFCPEDLEF